MSRHVCDSDAGRSVLVNVSSLPPGGERFGWLPEIDADSVVAVTYDRSADEFLNAWRRHAEMVPEFSRIISVGRTMRSASSASAGGTRNIVRTVQRPDDLREVRTAVESALESATGETALVFDSLTAPLEHVSLAEIIPFVAEVMDCLRATDCVGYFCLDTHAHDAPTVATLHAFADELIELNDDGTEWFLRSLAEGDNESPSLDVLFDALRSKRRRHALRYLLRATDPVPVEELASAVADSETDGTTTRNQHRRYYATLYQLHLPKLDDAGLVDHDVSNHLVSAREAMRWVEPFLALSEESAF